MESETPGIDQQSRAANELLLRVLRDESSDYEIAFFCECERPGCYAPLWLTRAGYEARLAGSQPIVLSSHLVPVPSLDRDLFPLREPDSTSARKPASPRRVSAGKAKLDRTMDGSSLNN